MSLRGAQKRDVSQRWHFIETGCGECINSKKLRGGTLAQVKKEEKSLTKSWSGVVGPWGYKKGWSRGNCAWGKVPSW